MVQQNRRKFLKNLGSAVALAAAGFSSEALLRNVSAWAQTKTMAVKKFAVDKGKLLRIYKGADRKNLYSKLKAAPVSQEEKAAMALAREVPRKEMAMVIGKLRRGGEVGIGGLGCGGSCGSTCGVGCGGSCSVADRARGIFDQRGQLGTNFNNFNHKRFLAALEALQAAR